MLEQPPSVPAFNYLPKRIQKEKKVVSVPEIHIHLPDNLNVRASSSTQAEKDPEVIYKDYKMEGPSPSAFKTKVDYSDWKF